MCKRQEIFSARYLCQWLGPPLTIMQHVWYFWFCGRRYKFAHNGLYGAYLKKKNSESDPPEGRIDSIPPLIGPRRMLKMTQQGPHTGYEVTMLTTALLGRNSPLKMTVISTVGYT